MSTNNKKRDTRRNPFFIIKECKKSVTDLDLLFHYKLIFIISAFRTHPVGHGISATFWTGPEIW